MTTRKFTGAIALAAAMVVGAASVTFAGPERVTGFITSRLAAGFIMQTVEGTVVNVALSDATKLKVDNGPGRWEAAQLQPGLRVTVEGAYDPAMTLMASEIKFGKSDLRLATAIRSGLTPTAEQVARNVAKLGEHGQALNEHGATLNKHEGELVEHDQRIVATTGIATKANERINLLANYNQIESVTVLFKNGKAKVPAEFVAQLQEFANKAKGVSGYKVAVQGFASAVGPKGLNDVLSHNRAENVTAILQQSGIPTDAILVPAAMGTTEQVAENKTAKGQAQNRRVVVTILQNKGIAEK